MPVIFPYSKKTQQCPDQEFIAAWKQFVIRFGPAGADPATVAMPVGSQKAKLDELLGSWRKYSLDVLCRLLVAERNTMQAAPDFRARNKHLLEELNTGARDEVRLTDLGKTLLATVTPVELQAMSALFEADLEDDSDGLVAEGLVEAVSAPVPARTTQCAPVKVSDVIDALVNWIEHDPFTPFHRGQPVLDISNQPIVANGWAARLESYFWPTPGVGVSQTRALLKPVVKQAASLCVVALSRRQWTAQEERDAVAFANTVFRWGGVPQRTVQAAMVREVFESVANGHRIGNAPMNSGWTKVAAFASEHAGPGRETVIWDSRVAHSLISRLDVLLPSALRGMPPFNGIGYVPGRGGTRVGNLTYKTRWQNGYGRWDVQFAGSELVRLIRNEVNRQQQLGRIGGGHEMWTVRDVEMVLFMDGY